MAKLSTVLTISIVCQFCQKLFAQVPSMGFYLYRGGSTFDLGVPTHKSKKGVLKSRSSRGSGFLLILDGCQGRRPLLWASEGGRDG